MDKVLINYFIKPSSNPWLFMDVDPLRKSLVLRHMRYVPGFVRADDALCPFEPPDGEIIGWYRSKTARDHSAVFTTKAIRLFSASDITTLRWESIRGFVPPWHDKRGYREHRSLWVQTTEGWLRIRMGITNDKYPHVDSLAQVLRALYPSLAKPRFR